jgi:transposase
VDRLDLSLIQAVYEKENRGNRRTIRDLITKLLVYGYCTGVFSSRRIQKRVQEDILFKVLAAGNEPDFRTISDFRKIPFESLKNMFEQVLAMALECGSIKFGKISLDGTKLKANASKHKATSYGRMIEKQQQLEKEVKQQAEACRRPPMSRKIVCITSTPAGDNWRERKPIGAILSRGRGPAVGQQFVELLKPALADAGEYILEPDERVDLG